MIKYLYYNRILPIIKNNIVKNILWLSFDRLFKMGIGLIVGIWMARYLGPTELGKLNYLMAYIAIIASISTLGMDNFLVKELSQHPEKKHEMLGTGLFMRLGVVITLLIVPLCIFSFLKLPSEYFKIYLLLSLTVLFSPLDLIDVYYQSILKSRYTVLSKNIAYFIGALLKIYLILFKKSLIYFALVLGLEGLFAMIFLLYKYQKEKNIFIWKYKNYQALYLLKKCWPLMLASIVVTLYMKVDQIMLGAMKGVREVGEFSAAVKISEMFFFIPIAISTSFLPELARLYKEVSMTEYLRKIQFFFDVIFITAIIIAVPVSLFANFFVHTLYGNAYTQTGTILIIHIWSLIPVFMGLASSQFLIVENLEKIAFYRTALGLIVNIALNCIFIPRFGGIGAAYATLISYFVATFFLIMLFKRTRILFRYQFRSFLAPVNFLIQIRKRKKLNDN
ncbi:MAG: flippase [Bacteroidota bacterium]